MARLSICLLGPFRIALDGNPVTAFESDKVRALLAYLAVESQAPQRRERLAGLLWPDWAERSARANLSRALSNLRHAIGDRDISPPFLHVTRQTIQWNCASDAWIDVNAFTNLLHTGQSSHRTADEQAIQPLEGAAALYRGDFLEGFSLPSCPAFEEWALFEGERLRRLALEALGHLSEWHEERGEVERALEHAWRRVELDPCLEGARRQVMRLLAQGGQRGAALAQYEACRRFLVDELGVEPSAETVVLYERIRDEAAAIPSGTPPHNLRGPLTPFVGRQAELAHLGDRLRDPDCHLLSLVGPGGIGKTRLAVEAARVHMYDYPQGVFQVRLVGLQSAEAIVPTIAEAIGFRFHREGNPREQLLNYLQGKRMLLILDNFEHLLVDPEPGRRSGLGVVVDILRAAPGVTAVITSRTRLNLKGEYLFPVEGLAYPPLTPAPSRPGGRGQNRDIHLGQAQDLAAYDAIKLFVSGAQRACPDFRLADHSLPVARICHLVEGMPLAVLLASAWVGTLSPAEIEARIGRGLDLLATSWRDVPERHRSIRAAFDHSWHLLTGRERERFAALTVFRGSFDRQAARKIVGASARELRSLVDKSFLHHLPAGRYEVHELLRQYGADALYRADKLHRADKLDGAGRFDAGPTTGQTVRDRHSAYYVAALERWGKELKGPRQMAALTELEADADNIRAAWDWAAEGRQVRRLDQALEGLCLFYDWRGRYEEGRTACRRAAERLGPESTGDSLRVLARILSLQATFERLLDRAESVMQLLQESQDLLDHRSLASQDVRGERAFLLQQRGHMALHSDREEARRWHRESLALYRAVGDDWGTATVLRELGRIAFYLGDWDEARPWMEESLAIRNALGDQMGIADSMGGLGNILRHAGQLEEAERLERESLAIHRGMGSQWGISADLTELGTMQWFLGKFDEAGPLLEEAISIRSDLGLGWELAHVSAVLGLNDMALGRYEKARTQGQRVLSFAQEIDYPRGVAQACWLLGQVALARQAYSEARDWLQEGTAIQRRIEHREEVGLWLATLAYASRGLGQRRQARQQLCEALTVGAEMQSFLLPLYALPASALLLADQGEGERAVDLYALASRFPHVGNSHWFEEIAGQQIAAVAADLLPDVAAAAQERGRARDLWATVAESLDELEDERQGVRIFGSRSLAEGGVPCGG